MNQPPPPSPRSRWFRLVVRFSVKLIAAWNGHRLIRDKWIDKLGTTTEFWIRPWWWWKVKLWNVTSKIKLLFSMQKLNRITRWKLLVAHWRPALPGIDTGFFSKFFRRRKAKLMSCELRIYILKKMDEREHWAHLFVQPTNYEEGENNSRIHLRGMEIHRTFDK